MEKKSDIIPTEKNEFIDDGIDYTVTEYKAGKAVKNIFDILEAFTYAIAVVILLFTFFIRLSIVDGPSMNNTLQDGNYLVVANVFFTFVSFPISSGYTCSLFLRDTFPFPFYTKTHR